jgi:hypothetical protein
MTSVSHLESIYADLENEHERVMKLLARLRGDAIGADLLSVLDELHTLLNVHFAREQQADGFYDALGELAESRRGELDELIDEHAAILSHLDNLLKDVKDSPVVDKAGVLDRVSALLEQLDNHEQKEHLFATDVLRANSQSC